MQYFGLVYVWEIPSDFDGVHASAVLLFVYLPPTPACSFTGLPPNVYQLLTHACRPMPPKKASKLTMLTDAEKMLMLVASRIDTAIRYKEAYGEEDDDHYLANLYKEEVSITFKW